MKMKHKKDMDEEEEDDAEEMDDAEESDEEDEDESEEEDEEGDGKGEMHKKMCEAVMDAADAMISLSDQIRRQNEKKTLAPVVNVAAPSVTVSPASVSIPSQPAPVINIPPVTPEKPRPTQWEIEVTSRDGNGSIAKATLKAIK